MGIRKSIPIGSVYNKWTVIKESGTIHGTYQYQCRCECGYVGLVQARHLRNGSTKGCFNCKQNYKSRYELSGVYMTQLHRSASTRNIAVEVTIDDLVAQYQKQQGMCALSGQPIRLMKKKVDPECNASLDRIDSSLPYIVDNIQWVEKELNRLKNNYSEEDFIKMCKLVAYYR